MVKLGMTTEHTKMTRKIFHITQIQIERLQKLSRETGLSIAEHVRRALDMYLKEMDG